MTTATRGSARPTPSAPAAAGRPADRPVRVAVVGGGRASEHEVSLASARGVATALAGVADGTAYEVVTLTIGRDGRWSVGGPGGSEADGTELDLAAAVRVLQACDVVVPVLHGPHGEDGTLAALCDLAGVPCVGSAVGAGALAMDKWATKQVARAVGVAVAPDVLLTAADAAAYLAHHPVDRPLDHPVVVKPVAAGSSHGVSLVTGRGQLAPALHAAFALDARVLVEDVVVGREIDLAVLGRPDGSRVVAPALEILGEGIFDADTKYDGTARFLVPAPLTPTELAALEGAAVAVYDALGCAGVARVDFFLTADGPVLNEVNTMPGFTAQSQVPRMFAACGTSYGDLLDLLVRDALTHAAPAR